MFSLVRYRQLAAAGLALALGNCVLDRTGMLAQGGAGGGTNEGGAGAGDAGAGGTGGSVGGNSNNGGTAGAGGEPECTMPSDCRGTDEDCSYRVCDGGTCAMEDAPEGTTCDDDGGNTCDGSGNCRLGDGSSCTDAGPCISGNCVDTVCCDGTCADSCESCNLAGSIGTCTPIAANTDPDSECTPGVCDGSAACAAGTIDWSSAFGDAGAFQQGWAVASDLVGNLLVTGHFDGTVDFLGGAPLTAVDGTDLFVVKLNPAGSYMWSRRFGGTLDDRAFGVATDGNNGVVVTGHFRGGLDFSAGASPLSTAGDFDIFVAKFDTNGIYEWSKQFGDSSDQFGYRVATDSANNVVLFGSFEGTVDFSGANALDSAGDTDLFLAKFEADGTYLWSQRYGDAETESAFDVAIDSADNIWVTGGFAGDLDFGGGALTSAGVADAYVARLDGGNGDELFAQRYGDAQGQHGKAIDIAPGNAVFVAGEFGGSIDLGGGALTAMSGDRQIYVGKLDVAGAHLFSSAYGDDTSDQFVEDVAADEAGNVSVVGAFAGSIDFGAGSHNANNGSDVYVAKLAHDLTALWSHGFGNTGEQIATGVAASPTGAIGCLGFFESNLTIGLDVHTNQGGQDIFVAHFAP